MAQATPATDEQLDEIHSGKIEVIDDIGDGHTVRLAEKPKCDSTSVSVEFHAEGRYITVPMSKEEFRLDTGQPAENFNVDAILVTPAHINGDIHAEAQNVYEQIERKQ